MLSYMAKLSDRVQEAFFSAFMSISESPSCTTRSITISSANSCAYFIVRASSSIIVKGRGIYCNNEAITRLTSFLMTTLTLPSSHC